MSKKRKKSGHYDPERETCEPQAMTPDGLLVRAAGAPIGKAKAITYYTPVRVVVTLPKDPIRRPMPRDPYTGEL